jgi:poly(3-hydroxybutyrate) depolymerase
MLQPDRGRLGSSWGFAVLALLAGCTSASAPQITSAPSPLASTAPALAPLPIFVPSAAPSGRSRGCGKPNPAQGKLARALGGIRGKYLLTLPPGYDANTPFPLVFAFHGRDRSHLLMHEVDAPDLQPELGGKAVLVYVKSQGDGWDWPRELAPSLQFFEALFPRLLDEYCIDTARVFAVGHSSGGYFANIVACRHGEDLRGVALVAGAAEEQVACGAPVAALIIHGVRDRVVPVSRGWSEREHYLARNRCSGQSTRGAEPECTEYTGCAAGLPVVWCEHEEPTERDTNHGWPSFASRAIARFVEGLKEPERDALHNLLKSSTLEASAEAVWQRFFVPPARGQSPEIAGAACLRIEAPGVNAWDIQIAQRQLRIQRGRRYTLDFRAWASAPSALRAKLGKQVPPYEEYWANRFTLGPAPRRFRAEVTMGSPDDDQAELAFQLGAGSSKPGPVSVCVDDVYLSDPAYEAGSAKGAEP